MMAQEEVELDPEMENLYQEILGLRNKQQTIDDKTKKEQEERLVRVSTAGAPISGNRNRRSRPYM